MKAREYFEKEYGHEHIEMVADMKDWFSLYGLMDEFAEWKVKNCSIPAVSNRRELLCAFFKYFRDNGEANIGMSIEQFVDDFLSTQ